MYIAETDKFIAFLNLLKKLKQKIISILTYLIFCDTMQIW